MSENDWIEIFWYAVLFSFGWTMVDLHTYIAKKIKQWRKK